jgi:hypothetical protein
MISHDYKCIFVHIMRCAGTSVEQWICQSDWWFIEHQTKHLLTSQARSLYRDDWDSYFKFAIVRNPFDRMVSCQKRDAKHFGMSIDENNRLSFDGYYAHFGREIVIEHDYRFSRREAVVGPQHRRACVYGNILDETLDFIGKYENLENDLKYVGEMIGLKLPAPLPHLERSGNRIRAEDLHPQSRREIERLFRDDFERFGYVTA